MQTIAGRTGLVAEVQPPTALRQLDDVAHLVRDLPEQANLPTTASFRYGNRHRRLVDIQADKNGIVYLGRPPCLRIGAGQPGAILDWDMPWGGPPLLSDRKHRV